MSVHIPAAPLYAFSLHRPWPWAILHIPEGQDPKRLENRGRPPWPGLVGQRVAIHAAHKWASGLRPGNPVTLGGLRVPPAEDHPTGIVGVATIRGWFRVNDWLHPARVTDSHGLAGGVDDALRLMRSRWFIGPVAWVLDDVRALPWPILCPGRQSLFWAVPPVVQAGVVAQIAEARP